MIDFDDDLLEKIKYKIDVNENIKDFVLNNNNYFIISSYAQLKDLNKIYRFINILNKKKSDSEKYDAELEKVLENNYFIINFDLDLKKTKVEFLNKGNFLYIRNSIFFGELTNIVDIEDEECFEGKLILDDCFVKKEIDFIFDPVYFEAKGCKFKNTIKIHDLPDGFVASHSEFKDIDLESFSLDKAYLYRCYGDRLSINFDYYEPDFKSLKMEDCTFEEVIVNSNESASKVISEEIILDRCNFDLFYFNKLLGLRLIIDGNNIGNISVIKSIISQEFIFTNQSFNSINLIDTYFTGKTLFDLDFVEYADMDKTLKNDLTDEEFLYNIESFLRIAVNEENPEIKLKLKYFKDYQKNKVYNRGITRFSNNLLDLTTGYFTNYKRIVITMVSIIIIFGFIYSLFPRNILIDGQSLNFIASGDYLSILYNSMYFSLITFTTIVYGNISPIGILKLFSGIEGLLGVLTTASLITVFARKFT